MLYLMGLGLDFNTLPLDGIEKIKKCNRIYLESYTVDFPYDIEKLEKTINKKITPVKRDFVESLKIVKESKRKNVALLIYGSPLFATTHISIIEECKKQRIKFEIISNASILDAVAETGLQVYKFGKITSMPSWKKSYEPSSFLEIVRENNSIGAHSLILIDINMKFENALKQFEESLKREKMKIDKLVICSCLGTKKSKIYYDKIENLKNKKVDFPFCFIIPRKLHFVEKEFLESI